MSKAIGVALLAFACVTEMAFGQASFREIDASCAYAVSADGQTVVGQTDVAGAGEAFRWSETDGLQLLGFLPDYSNSQALSVSGNGSIVVGVVSGVSGGGGYTQPFRWTAGTGITQIGNGSYLYGYASGISDDGTMIVGGGQTWCGNFWGSFGGNMSTNDDGSVLAFEHRHFTCIGNGNLTEVQLAPPGEVAATDVSPDGNWVVGYGNWGVIHGSFLWSASTGLQSLGSGAAQGVSANGAVVIGESPEGAFVWDATNGRRLLKDVLENDYCLDLRGWNLYLANGISDDGLTIVGCGAKNGNPGRAWIAKLPATPLLNEINCSDGIDDDCDGYTDCADTDCASNVLDCPSGRVPTVSSWGLTALLLSTLAAGTLVLRRRNG